MNFLRTTIIILAILVMAAPALARSANRSGGAQNPTPVFVLIPENMTSQQFREQVVHTAYSQLGLSYLLGGTTPQEGFDCSGFMRWVFSMVDVKLPRTSRDQFAMGTAVDKANLIPGDLVFFRNGRHIGHVGLYVGSDYFIHSPNKRSEIMISKLGSAGWANKYAGARRIVPQP